MILKTRELAARTSIERQGGCRGLGGRFCKAPKPGR